MVDEVPTAPEFVVTLTPDTRPCSSAVTVGTGACAVICEASTVATVLPSTRFSVAPGVPVTTTWSSATSTVFMRKSTVVVSPETVTADCTWE